MSITEIYDLEELKWYLWTRGMGIDLEKIVESKARQIGNTHGVLHSVGISREVCPICQAEEAAGRG